jgi:hypothetical protein
MHGKLLSSFKECLFKSCVFLDLHLIPYMGSFFNIDKELLNYYIKGNCLKNHLVILYGANIMTN